MPTNNETKNPDGREPVSREFSKFEQNYGGDAVNAHDDRMDSKLHDNAEKLDDELASGDDASR